jgi:hypothetical protein
MMGLETAGDDQVFFVQIKEILLKKITEFA